MTMTEVTQPITTPAFGAARVSWMSGTSFVMLLFILHILKPELDPSWRFISEYQIGTHGWIMTAAFLLFAGSCCSAFIALRPHVRSKGGRFGLWLLMVSALGLGIAGIFPTDPVTASAEEMTASGGIHQFGAMLDLIPFAALLISWSLARGQAEWRSRRIALYITGVAPILGTAAFIVSMAVMLPPDGQIGPDVALGWFNRFMILTHCGWVILITLLADRLGSQIRRMPASPL